MDNKIVVDNYLQIFVGLGTHQDQLFRLVHVT